MSESDKSSSNNDAHRVLRLSRADATALIQALMSPPEPSPCLVEAVRCYLKWKRS